MRPLDRGATQTDDPDTSGVDVNGGSERDRPHNGPGSGIDGVHVAVLVADVRQRLPRGTRSMPRPEIPLWPRLVPSTSLPTSTALPDEMVGSALVPESPGFAVELGPRVPRARRSHGKRPTPRRRRPRTRPRPRTRCELSTSSVVVMFRPLFPCKRHELCQLPAARKCDHLRFDTPPTSSSSCTTTRCGRPHLPHSNTNRSPTRQRQTRLAHQHGLGLIFSPGGEPVHGAELVVHERNEVRRLHQHRNRLAGGAAHRRAGDPGSTGRGHRTGSTALSRPQ